MRQRRRRNGSDEARELQLFIENDGGLYRQQYAPINKNLATKKARGVYNHTGAVKLFRYLVDNGAKKYAKEFGGHPSEWSKMFSVADRNEVAKNLADHFEVEYGYGNYDRLLPKKYQKKNPSTHTHRVILYGGNSKYSVFVADEYGHETEIGNVQKRAHGWSAFDMRGAHHGDRYTSAQNAAKQLALAKRIKIHNPSSDGVKSRKENRTMPKKVTNTYQMRKYNRSGEKFVCHLESMTMSDILHHGEEGADLEDYVLDNDMTQEDLDNSTVIREKRLNPSTHLRRGPFGGSGTFETSEADLLKQISPGDRVTIVSAHGQTRTGKAVMLGPGGWVLNMGGKHGTPAVANARNIVKIVQVGRKK